jgi:hypothetical protein
VIVESAEHLSAPRSRDQREALPDPALFWRWVGGSTRPLIGWVLAAIGVIVIIVGWFGVSGQALVAKQLPYLISGGLGGVALVGVGAALIGTERLRREAGRMARLEDMVEELRGVLLTHPDAPAASPAAAGTAAGPSGTAPVVAAASVGQVLAVPSGTTYHRAECSMVRGKPAVEPVTAAQIDQRGLTPCRICEPDAPRS